MTMRIKILELRKQGKNYNEICDILKCSKGTVAYHCGDGQKSKTQNRTKLWRRKNTLTCKLRNFIYPGSRKRNKYKSYGSDDKDLTVKNLKIKFGLRPKCYLTGLEINLDNPEEYSLDHIIPTSREGKNTLENCGLVCQKANSIKNSLTCKELVEFCKLIIKNLENDK